MNTKNYFLVTALIFSVIGVLHLLRIVYVWEAAIGGWMLPMWLSWIALAVAGWLAYHGFKLNK